MFKRMRYFGALLLLANASSFASVWDIEFEGAAGLGNSTITSHSEGGYILSSSHMHIVGSPTLCEFGGCVANPAVRSTPWSSSGQYLAQEGGSLGGAITLKLESGTLFNLRHFSIAELFLDATAASGGGFPNATTVTITGVKYHTDPDFQLGINAEIVTASFTLDGIKDGVGGLDDFQVVSPPLGDPRYFAGEMFRAVSSVTFSADGAFSLDGIRVTVAPEPATWALFLLGLASLVYFRRRATRSAKMVA